MFVYCEDWKGKIMNAETYRQFGHWLHGGWNGLMHAISHMNTSHWVAVMVVAMAFGAFCMRGFGSRSAY
jgi:hypothetical protein